MNHPEDERVRLTLGNCAGPHRATVGHITIISESWEAENMHAGRVVRVLLGLSSLKTIGAGLGSLTKNSLAEAPVLPGRT